MLLIALTAVLSHHIRDANRRGLWFWPFGSTPPIVPDILYMTLISMIPLLVWQIKKMFFVEADMLVGSV